ncbi:MAG: bifunctional phosphoserine phosphatase/homoserine phosphotransferase ThrH [Rhodospirillaceae bacterium]|nr:bifunctional phosphoserine phosphatase/homoserine phosphotransferase ThrH [Rhodospirillaceae bacterium]MBT5939249.1 bifunctional phosphoserine phosphatase/homoserine phosphotransferase ThrH [Rhodospirillaceae bacterium]
MEVVCLDLEGVLIPEIWIGVAEKTGIETLRDTTRDIPDYDELMQQRLRIMAENGLGLPIIQEVIAGLDPLDGALEFMTWLREHFQVIILSDTFYEFGEPFMRKLDWPTLFCHRLETNSDGKIVNYHLRMKDHKCEAVKSLHDLNFTVFAAGDSYNDTSMLNEADQGILFKAPAHVIEEFPQFPAVNAYDELRAEIEKASPRF